MAYALYGEIRFPANKERQEFKIKRFSAVKIETSWKSLTDTAEIVLPRGTRDIDRHKVTSWFREGDPVEILLGYSNNPPLEFSGYISQISTGIPLILKLEDEMYRLKRKTVSVSLPSCSLKQLLLKIAPNYKIQCDESKLLGNVLYENKAASEVLEDLSKSGIYCWFEGKTLHASTASRSMQSPIEVVLEKSVSETLKQKPVEDIMVTVSLQNRVGKKQKIKFGDEGAGKQINREYSGANITQEGMLAEAKQIYAQAKKPGLDGDITLFGIPRTQHGLRVNFKSWLYPEKNSTYYIDAVTKTFDDNGYRQVCKLGDKAV